MSEQESHIGKIKQIPVETSLEETAEAICKSYGITECSSYNDTWLEELRDTLYGGYIVAGGNIYKVIEDNEQNYSDIFHAVKCNDGTISYAVSFYNGGCSFSEAIGYALEKMNDN